jgi:hypothetical protein
MLLVSILHPSHPPQAQKAKLVELGLACLARAEWAMAQAIHTTIRRGGYAHV